jgi:hypothetical protein
MFKNILLVIFVFSLFSTDIYSQSDSTKKTSPWRFRGGVNLNGLRTRTLELSGQALQKGKFIYNFNIGYTYQTPRAGYQSSEQKAADSLGLVLKTSGFFIKPGVQANLFTLSNKFTKADVFIGTGFTQTWYNRKTTYTDLKPVVDVKKTGEFKGSAIAPFVSLGGNLRLLYNVYLDLGLQYNLTKTQSNDKITPQKYDYIPGMGGNFKNGNKATFLFLARYEFN